MGVSVGDAVGSVVPTTVIVVVVVVVLVVDSVVDVDDDEEVVVISQDTHMTGHTNRAWALSAASSPHIKGVILTPHSGSSTLSAHGLGTGGQVPQSNGQSRTSACATISSVPSLMAH